MSKLTFGVELEMFIKQNVSLHKLIMNEMKINGFTTFKELVIFIINKTTYTLLKHYIKRLDLTSDFTKCIECKLCLDGKYRPRIRILDELDHIFIIFTLIYIICKNNKNISERSKRPLFSLPNIISIAGYDTYEKNLEDNIYFEDYNKNTNWHYDIDSSIYILQWYQEIKTYRTIYDNFPQILTRKDFVFYTEFVSGIYNNPSEVKEGVSNLISSITDLKITPLHSKHTSNHIHFSIKKEKDTDLGIKDPYLVFCIIYVFYVLQNLLYLICLPERRTSDYSTPLELMLNTWSKSLDEFTLDEFFDTLITMEIPQEDKECYLDNTEIDRITVLLSEISNIKETSKKIMKKIENLNNKIKKLTTLPNYIENKPFKNLVFEHQLLVLMHLYHKYTSYKMNTNFKKYTINTVSTYEIGRYKILNLKKLSERKSCTLELRVKHGSNDATEISNFCILIEKLVNVAEQMVVNKHIPLLKSLASILNISESELLSFKSIESKNLNANYESQKPLLKKILKGLYKTDTDNITYWQKQLKRINELKDPKDSKTVNSLKSKSFIQFSSNSRKRTL
jgi:hypothetical protein